jgi:hypothetical protein
VGDDYCLTLKKSSPGNTLTLWGAGEHYEHKMSFNIIAQHGTALPIQLLNQMVNPVMFISKNKTEKKQSDLKLI